MAPEKEIGFFYIGENKQYPPDQKVFYIVSNLLHFFADKVPGSISARVKHSDRHDLYCITFALEGKVFLKILYVKGNDKCWIEDDHYGPRFSTQIYFTLEELQTKWIPQQIRRVLESKQRDVTYSLTLLAAAIKSEPIPAEK